MCNIVNHYVALMLSPKMNAMPQLYIIAGKSGRKNLENTIYLNLFKFNKPFYAKYHITVNFPKFPATYYIYYTVQLAIASHLAIYLSLGNSRSQRIITL